MHGLEVAGDRADERARHGRVDHAASLRTRIGIGSLFRTPRFAVRNLSAVQ
jgi:hypothetical protein